jgi:UDP-hydrolysing UDP-N-acetyl-D-glucosamine 2-epimerase
MANKKRKILYVSGTRADYGLMREVLIKIQNSPKLSLEIAVMGMHLMPEFGNTINEIKNDRFKIHQIKAIYKNDTKESMAKFIGQAMCGLSEKIKSIKPDIILLLGDRGEMLAGAIVGAYMSIPVAHVHGGDVSGTVDDLVRNAITKLSNFHFAATKKSVLRLEQMGVDKKTIYLSGAPGIDAILNNEIFSKLEIANRFELDLNKPIILAIQHAVTSEFNKAASQMKETLEAIKKLKFDTILIYPNSDAGGGKIINVIKKYNKYKFIKVYKNIPRKEYLSLMNVASVMVGNSSSGIVESSVFHLPVVNIGTREHGRERAGNVLDVDYKEDEIRKAIEKSIFDGAYLKKVERSSNLYGDGTASSKIVDVLEKIQIDKNY